MPPSESVSQPLSSMATPGRPDRVGVLAALGGYWLWALFPVYFHRLDAVNPFEIAAHRVIWTVLFVAIVLSVVKREGFGWDWFSPFVADRRQFWLLAGAGVLLSINWLTYVWAVVNDHIVDASMGYFTNPILTVGLGVFLLHERLRRLQKLALGFGAAALGVSVIGSGQFPVVAVVLAATFSTYSFLKKKVGLPTFPSLFIEMTAIFPVALVGLLISEVLGSPSFGHDTHLSLLLSLAGIVTALPLALFGVATRRVPLSVLGLLQYMTPIGILLMAIFVYHERAEGYRWVSFGLIWVGLMCLTYDSLASRRVRQEPTLAAAQA